MRIYFKTKIFLFVLMSSVIAGQYTFNILRVELNKKTLQQMAFFFVGNAVIGVLSQPRYPNEVLVRYNQNTL